MQPLPVQHILFNNRYSQGNPLQAIRQKADFIPHLLPGLSNKITLGEKVKEQRANQKGSQQEDNIAQKNLVANLVPNHQYGTHSPIR